MARFAAWSCVFAGPVLVALAVGHILFLADGDYLFEKDVVSNPALAELVDMVVDLIVWFESSNPVMVGAVFLVADLAAGALVMSALLAARQLYTDHATHTTAPLVLTLVGIAAQLAVAAILGSLRFLVAFASSAVGLLCPSPENCGTAVGLLFPYAECGMFLMGLTAPALVELNMWCRASRGAADSES